MLMQLLEWRQGCKGCGAWRPKPITSNQEAEGTTEDQGHAGPMTEMCLVVVLPGVGVRESDSPPGISAGQKWRRLGHTIALGSGSPLQGGGAVGWYRNRRV